MSSDLGGDFLCWMLLGLKRSAHSWGKGRGKRRKFYILARHIAMAYNALWVVFLGVAFDDTRSVGHVLDVLYRIIIRYENKGVITIPSYISIFFPTL